MYRLDEIVKEMRERGMNVPVLPQRIIIPNGTSVMMQYFQYFMLYIPCKLDISTTGIS